MSVLQNQPEFTLFEIAPEDFPEMTEMRLQSWLDTYVNEAAGVSKEWIEARNKEQRSVDTSKKRLLQFTTAKQKGKANGWVAKDTTGRIIGGTTPFVDKNGRQRLGSLYVDRHWQGKGVGSALLQKVIAWHDPEIPIHLVVVRYNEKAKAFYRKWGFVEIPGSEETYEEIVPEITMIRKAQNEIQS